MIPRYQTILFFVLLASSIAMGGILWHLRDRAQQRLMAGEAPPPTRAPEVAPVQNATLMVANDATDSLEVRELTLPLPPSSNERAQAVLGKLLDLYAAPGSTHPVPGGATSIAQVFLLPVKPASATAPEAPRLNPLPADAAMAVVNLTAAFAASHPSGIETETLTLLSICATLHANLPQVSEVRFLVDGRPRATLADHADLMRTYLTADLETGQETHP
ncbi:MAG: GerMN domain-containing protein [Acidobacteriota bacterium]